jgi:peroxiredoxin
MSIDRAALAAGSIRLASGISFLVDRCRANRLWGDQDEPAPTATAVAVLIHHQGVGGVRIVADRLGDPAAPAVVFLHGGGQTRRSWGGAAAAVAERGWQAIPVDLRGHGESDWSKDGDYRVTTFAGDVVEVLRHLPRPVLVGASLGGFTAMLLAGELSPATVHAVVLVDIVRGQMSDLVTKERADEFLSRFPEIDFVDVGGAGHMVAGDRNDHFAGAVVEFLARHAEDR